MTGSSSAFRGFKLVVPAYPLHREFEALLVAALHEVEVLVGAVQRLPVPKSSDYSCGPQITSGATPTCGASDDRAGVATILVPCRNIVLHCPAPSTADCMTSPHPPGWA